jgi:hypothetical protein
MWDKIEITRGDTKKRRLCEHVSPTFQQMSIYSLTLINKYRYNSDLKLKKVIMNNKNENI